MNDRRYAHNLPFPRTQPTAGKDQPHTASPIGVQHPTGIGLERSPEAVLRALGEVVQDIRDHVHAALPRPEDKDFSILKQHINGDKRSDPPVGRVSLNAAGDPTATAEIRIQMGEGFTGHVTGIIVQPTDPLFDLKDLTITLTLRGATLAVSRISFARPHVIELNDEIVLTLQNLAATPITVEYAVQGWLRRES